MLVRTFALWSALGMTVATAAGLAVPTSASSAAIRPDPPSVAGGGTSVPTGGPHFVDGKVLLLDGRLGHSSFAGDPSGRPASTFVLATVTAPDRNDGTNLAPPRAELSIAIDRSGSMAGAKMSNAIAAAVEAVERMRDDDLVSIVAFDASARLLVPPTRLDSASRASIEQTVRGMHTGGDTCISCAVERATEALASSGDGLDSAKRILLISDGEATTGVRDVAGLRDLAARARDRGLTLSTIGVDLNFDERVMAAMAEEGNGRHWFVPDASALSGIFDQEVGALESTLATNAELSIEPAPGVVLDDVRDRAFRREGGRIVVPLGTVGRADEKTVLVSARVPTDRDGTRPVVAMSLVYRDVATHREARCDGSLAVDVRSDGTGTSDLDPFVAARVERSQTEHALLDANTLFERGRVSEARAALARRQNDLALTVPTTLARAASTDSPAASASRDVGGDFDEQEKALQQAQAGFAAAPPAPAGALPAASPAAKSALKTNQANASDLTR